MMEESLARICQALGYVFRDVTLLRAALTHRSHASENLPARDVPERYGRDNERLEFLGDAVLGLVIAEALWTRVPGAREGELSRLRAAVVNEASLAEVAAAAHLGEGLRLGRGEHRTGGRSRRSTLADALEAVFAGVFLDGGMGAAREVILRALGARVDAVVTQGASDDKSTLQELLQARHRITPRYELVATYGPDHDREHEVELHAGDVVRARGRGRSKKEAEQAAARIALASLVSAASPAVGANGVETDSGGPSAAAKSGSSSEPPWR